MRRPQDQQREELQSSAFDVAIKELAPYDRPPIRLLRKRRETRLLFGKYCYRLVVTVIYR